MFSEETDRELATLNFGKWVAAVEGGDPREVSQLFSTGCSFHPTLAGSLHLGPAETEKYFVHFLSKNPTCKAEEEVVHRISPDSYVHAGCYTFQVDGNGGDRIPVEARFTFIWVRMEDFWKIQHFHSSQRPQ